MLLSKIFLIENTKNAFKIGHYHVQCSAEIAGFMLSVAKLQTTHYICTYCFILEFGV